MLKSELNSKHKIQAINALTLQILENSYHVVAILNVAANPTQNPPYYTNCIPYLLGSNAY